MLVNQKGFGFSLNDTMILPDVRHEDPVTGKRTYAKTSVHHVPAMYVKYTKDKFSFGIGLFSPFGLSMEWPKDWAGRYVSTFAEIKTIYVNPVLAYKVNDSLSLGGGFYYVESSVNMKRAADLSSLGLPDGMTKLVGDGSGIGYNAAVTVKLPNEYTVSATYRSATRIRYDGRANFYLPPPLASSSTGASATFTLPFIAVAGISKHIGPLTLEGDVIYTGWSSMSSYRVTSDNGSANSFFYKNWYNTPSIALGVNYELNKSLQIRGGYMFDKTPIPRKTLSPELPDSTRHIYTVGGTYQKNSFKINLGYQATFFRDVTSYSPALNGTYRTFAHVGLISLEYNQ